MYKDGSLACDQCQAVITRVVPPPDDGWPRLHNLCTACYAQLAQKAVPKA